VVENLYWFGRHAERCDDMARLLRLALARAIEEGPAERELAWASILGLLRHSAVLTEAEAAAGDASVVRLLRDAVLDDAKPGLASSVKQLLRVASQLRERLSLDNWRTLNSMSRRLARSRGRPVALSETLAELDRDIGSFITLAGFALDGMTRDHGWRFLSMGRRIERLQFLCGMLQEALAGPAEADIGWMLELADSSVTYRSRYMARPQWRPVLDLLVRDVANPRSIAFQLKGLHDFLGRIADAYGEGVEEKLDAAVLSLEALDPEADLQHGSAALAARLDEWYAASYRLSEQLGLRFFSLVGEVNRQTFAM
jgi:uncharacterized alpha-E superfamily protein